jgi:predicted nucleotidyltransferase
MSVAELPIQIDRKRIAEFCRAHGIRRLSVFGSVLRGDFDPARSDVDVLVELLPTARPGWEFFGWHEELEPMFSRKVDLHTPASLSQYFRDEVMREAMTLYEQA